MKGPRTLELGPHLQMKTPEKELGATEELKENVRASSVARRRVPLQLESSELASWRRAGLGSHSQGGKG